MAHMWDSKRNYTSTAHIGLTLSVTVFILITVFRWSNNKNEACGAQRSNMTGGCNLKFEIK